jgi:hypothetical protein
MLQLVGVNFGNHYHMRSEAAHGDWSAILYQGMSSLVTYVLLYETATKLNKLGIDYAF